MKFIPRSAADVRDRAPTTGARSDCGRIALAPDEQVTFTTEAGGEYDVTRKSWGFYATPSINGRLKTFGLRAALVRNVAGRVCRARGAGQGE